MQEHSITTIISVEALVSVYCNKGGKMVWLWLIICGLIKGSYLLGGGWSSYWFIICLRGQYLQYLG